MEKLLKLSEVEQVLSVSRATLKRWIYSKKIRAQKINNSWRISESSVEEFKSRGMNESQDGGGE